MRFVFIFIFFSSLISGCQEIDENKIVGNYAMDKFRFRDSSIKSDNYVGLNLQSDKTFKLKNQAADRNIEGSWKIKDYNSEEIFIEFKFADKKIVGKLKGNILYFEYPNEFHSGRYEDIKYVRSGI